MLFNKLIIFTSFNIANQPHSQIFMPNKPTFLLLFILFFLSQCVSENIEEKYANTPPDPVTVNEMAWFPLNGNLNDSTENHSMISVAGPVNYTTGLNKESGKGLILNGVNNYIVISSGYLDTIAILFWMKTHNGIANPNQPVMIDYGHNAASIKLIDAVTEATNLLLQHGQSEVNSASMGENYFLNTYNKFSLIYLEAGGTSAAFSFQGYLDDGTPHKISNHYTFPLIFDPITDLIYIGRSSDPQHISNSFFKGYIDEIHVFNHFLTNDELSYYLNIQPE